MSSTDNQMEYIFKHEGKELRVEGPVARKLWELEEEIFNCRKFAKERVEENDWLKIRNQSLLEEIKELKRDDKTKAL